jgi:xylose isomerase
MKIKVETHLWTLGSFSERDVPSGYYDDMDIKTKLEIMSKIKGLDALIVFYPTFPLPADPSELIKLLSNYNLKVGNMYVECSTDRKWKTGAFSSKDNKTRKECIKLCKEGIDFSKEVGANSVLLWPAHDGFDYVFQSDYSMSWNYLIETFKEIGEYDKNVRIAIEPKCKITRQRQYVSNTGKLMMLINDIGLNNVGGVVDTGHSFMAQESIAESLAILYAHDKLFQIHLNENYRDADPDLLFGSINFWENLEFFYFLSKTNYDGFLNIDITSPRDDRSKSLALGIKNILIYKKLAEKLTEHSDLIDKNLKDNNFVDNMELIEDILF